MIFDFNSGWIKRDDGDQSLLPTIEWEDRDDNKKDDRGRETRYGSGGALGIPLNYRMSYPGDERFVTANASFLVRGNVLGPLTLSAEGCGPGGGESISPVVIAPPEADGRRWLSGSYDTDGTAPLPETIANDDLFISWTIVKRAGATEEYGDSVNHVYVTGVDAGGSFETVLDLGCEGAAGRRPHNATDTPVETEDTNGNGVLDPGEDVNGNGVLDKYYSQDRGVVDGVWSSFSGNSTHRIDGVEMSYSHARDPITGDPEFGFSAAEMLARGDGRGQCTAWAELLILTLGVHGMVTTNTRIDPPGALFAVKPMPAQGSGGADYIPGTRAAGGFNFHQVVRVGVYPDRIYDPSYGGLTTKTDARSVELKYEDENITDLWVGPLPGGFWLADVPGDPLQLIFTP